MAAITEGNLLHQDEFSDTTSGLLSEYTRPPDDAVPVQTFPDVKTVFSVVADNVTQRTYAGGDVLAFESGATLRDIPKIDPVTAVVSLFITGADLWAGTTFPSFVYRVQVDQSNRTVHIYNDNGQLHARRISDVPVVLDTIVLENPLSFSVAASAVGPTGQYVYVLLINDPGGTTGATLYQYDLDNAGARTTVKTYNFIREANPGASLGMGLGCDKDGNIYAGYYTVASVASDTPPQVHDQYTYWVDKLSSSGSVLDTWQIHQYTNTAIYDPDPLDTASNDGFAPSFTTDIFGSGHTLWGWFYKSGFDPETASPPPLAVNRVMKLDLNTGSVAFSDWRTNGDTAGGRLMVLWPYGPRQPEDEELSNFPIVTLIGAN